MPSCRSLWQNTTGKSHSVILALIHANSLRKSIFRNSGNIKSSCSFLVLKFFRVSSKCCNQRSIVIHSQSGSLDTGILSEWIFAIFSATLREIFGSLSSLVCNGLACADEKKEKVERFLQMKWNFSQMKWKSRAF